MKIKYELTEAHREQLAPYAARWIANAMSTKPMDDADRAAMRTAIDGLYDAAKLARPKRIVFVDSPFVAVLAGSIAAGMWHLSEYPEAVFLPDAAIDEYEKGTAARKAMHDKTQVATHDAAWFTPRAAARPIIRALTRTKTRTATRNVTQDATEAAWEITQRALDEATRRNSARTMVTARASAIEIAVEAAIEATTRGIMPMPTDDEEAWKAPATATHFAVAAAMHSVAPNTIETPKRAALWAAKQLEANNRTVAFLARCTGNWQRLYNGGNQWSARAAYLSFFFDVVKLQFPIYGNWQHYQSATVHGGPRMMHSRFCIVSDRPEILLTDAENHSHCDDGPSHRWRDGWELFHIHGVAVSAQTVMAPETLNVEQIRGVANAEVRRIMMERFGYGRYIRESGALQINTDDWGTLWRAEATNHEPLMMVEVVNATPEPDGSFKDYWLRVDPELRPMSNGAARGEPQELTALNAIASTFGMTGRQYLDFLSDYPLGLGLAQS